jgi:uncharacterized membrane protein
VLAVRWLHVVAMAVVLGGATLTWWQFRDEGAEEEATSAALDTAAAYERGFWAAMGVLVMTGVGNLGSLARYVPASGTPWGTAFAAKLLLVVALVALSVVRTLLVARYRRAETPATSDRSVGVLRVGYAATALFVGILVVFAEVMAHG